MIFVDSLNEQAAGFAVPKFLIEVIAFYFGWRKKNFFAEARPSIKKWNYFSISRYKWWNSQWNYAV